MNDRQAPWRLAWSSRHGWIRLSVWIIVLAALPLVAYQMGKRAETVSEAVANAAPPAKTDVTATVERRILESGETFLGEVTSSNVAITAPASGVVVTIGVAAGDQVVEGQSVAVVDDRPLFILEGDLPLLHDLEPGATGSWVTQLQQALARIGRGAGVTGVFDKSTQDAVTDLYLSAGFTPPMQSEGTGHAGVPLPSTEAVFVRTLPMTVGESDVQRGDIVASGDVLMTLAASDPEVVIRASDADSTRFDVGSSVEVRTATGQTITATVASITNTQNNQGQPWLVTIVPDVPLASSMAGATVKVVVNPASTSGPVLVVPVTAIRSEADGSAYVEVETEPGDYRRVTVNAGLASGGFVEIAPVDGSLTEGESVRVASRLETGG